MTYIATFSSQAYVCLINEYQIFIIVRNVRIRFII